MDITRLSSRCAVRYLGEADLPALVRLGEGNPLFYRYSSSDNTEAGHREGMTLTPPGVPPERKHYVGFFDGAALAAVLDLVEGYPDRETVFLGFFMVAAEYAGRGVGSAIITELCGALKQMGFRRARLAIDRDNPQSNHFWKKNGFAILREVDRGVDVVYLAEREL